MRTITLKADFNTKEAEASAKRLGKAIETEFKRIKQQFSNFGGSVTTSTTRGGIDNELKRAQNEIRKYQQQQIRAEKDLTRQIEREAEQQYRAKVRNFQKATAEALKELRKIEAETKKQTASSGAFKGGFLGGFIGSVGASAISSITSLLSEGSSAVLEYSKNVEGLTIAFEQFAGGAQGAKKQIEELQKLNLETPFGLEALAQASQRLQGVGIESKKVIPLIKDIGNIVAATGKVSVERFDGITTAITQMIGKTKVSAEEMEQLAERGVPAWKILAEYTGNTQAELRKLGEQGKLTSDIMIAALQKIAKEKYGDALDKQNRTLEGSLNRIKNVLLEASRQWFKPLYDEASRFGSTFAERITANETKAKGLLENFGFSLGQSFKRGIDSGYLSIRSVVDALIGGGATSYGVQIGKGIAEGYNKPQGVLTPVDSSSLDPNYNPYGTFNGGTEKQVAAKKKMFDVLDKEAEKAKKEREALAKAELAAQIGLYQNQITEVERLYRESFSKISENFKETNDPQQFQSSFDQLKMWYGEQVNSLIPAWENLVKEQTLKEKKGQFERLEIYQETQRKKAEFEKATNDLEENAAKLLKEGFKKKSESEIKIAEESAKRKIEIEKSSAETRLKDLERDYSLRLVLEENYISTKNQLQLNVLEYEKTQLQEKLSAVKGNAEKIKEINHELALLDNNISQQKTENAQRVYDYQQKLAEKERESYQQFADIIQDLEYELQSLNVELGLSAELSTADRWAKELQSKAYENLDQKSRDLILTKAAEVDAAREAVKAQNEYREAFDRTTNTIENHLDALLDGGFKGLFKSILDDLKRFFIRATAEFLASRFLKLITGTDGVFRSGGNQSSGGGFLSNIFGGLFGGGGLGSILGGGNLGTGTGNPNILNFGGGGIQSTSDVTRTITLPNGQTVTAGGGGLGGVGIAAGIGLGANILGGLIGGRTGGLISSTGSGIATGAALGSVIPGIGTLIGGAVGGVVGFFSGLFGGDPKRKQDKKENLPALRSGFADALQQLRDLARDTRSLRVEPESAIAKATELRQQIASGFGINFLSKKYRKQSQSEIQSKLVEADALIKEIREAADIAGAANERRRRILPEFADGGAVSQFFSGLVPGMYDRKDDKLIKVSGNEVVLTPDQWRPITPYLQSRKVKGFADGGFVGSGAAAMSPNINLSINMYEREDGGFDAYLRSENGEKAVKVVVNRLKKNREI